MDEIHHANVQVTICSENHIHIRMTSNDDSDCPALDRMMDPDMARSFACAVLQAADQLKPVS